VVAPAKVRGGLDDVMVSQAMNGGGCCGGSAHAHPQPNGKAATNASDAKGRGVKYVLLDIEGTTTSISFVHDVLFPFARNATERHIRYRATLHLIHPGTAGTVVPPSTANTGINSYRSRQ
jgi:hypothetical protein